MINNTATSSSSDNPGSRNKSDEAKIKPILNLIFSRHAFSKFRARSRQNDSGSDPNGGSGTVPPVSRAATHLWQVLGRYDQLEINAHETLDTIACGRDEPNLDSDSAETDLTAYNGIVLVPFGDFRKTVLNDEDTAARQRFIDMVNRVQTVKQHGDSLPDPAKEYPLLFIAEFTLSPAAHQQGRTNGTYEDILQTIDECRRILQETYEKYCENLRSEAEKTRRLQEDDVLRAEEIFFFRSLGASDIVLVALPKTPDQLCALVDYVSAARKLWLHQLFCTSKKEQIPGHAFASVEDTIAYRNPMGQPGEFRYVYPKADEDFDETSRAQRVKEQETWWGVRIQTNVMVDCGHELDACGRAKEAGSGNSNNPLIAGIERRHAGLHTVQFEASGLEDFVRYWVVHVDDPRFRDGSLIDSSTSFSIVPRFPEWPQASSEFVDFEPAWRQSKKLTDMLKKIQTAISDWAGRRLPRDQAYELGMIVGTFCSAFSRLESATAVRDLLPFMRQLAGCCKRSDEWSEFENSLFESGDIKTFKSDVNRLISHLGRALQNRLESRWHHTDPTIYRTLEHGASKVVPAYSAIYWMTSELFSNRNETARDSDECSASRMAVCLAVGSTGHVRFEEIFTDFRAKYCKPDPNGEWNAPLILLDVSGPKLFEPELHAVHSCHETIRFSEWIMIDRLAELRRKFNLALLRYVVEEIWFRLGKYETWTTLSAAHRDLSTALESFFITIMKSRSSEHIGVHNVEDISTMDPRECLYEVISGIRSAAFQETSRDATLWQLLPDEFRAHINDAKIANLYDVEHEVVERLADILRIWVLIELFPRAFSADKLLYALTSLVLGLLQTKFVFVSKGDGRQSSADESSQKFVGNRVLEEDLLQMVSRCEGIGDFAFEEPAKIREYHQLFFDCIVQRFDSSPKEFLQKSLNEKEPGARHKSRLFQLIDSVLKNERRGGLNLVDLGNVKPFSAAELRIQRKLEETFGLRFKAIAQSGNSKADILELTLDRIELIMHFWAKSCRIGLQEIFEIATGN